MKALERYFTGVVVMFFVLFVGAICIAWWMEGEKAYAIALFVFGFPLLYAVYGKD